MLERTYRDGSKATPVKIFTHVINGVEVEFAHEISDPNLYRGLLAKAKEENRFGASVMLRPIEVYVNMKHLFISPTGDSGVAVGSDGYGGSAFSSPTAEKGVMNRLIELAYENGVDRNWCFDTILPNYYANYGSRVVARRRFEETVGDDGPTKDWSKEDQQYFVNNWDKETYSNFNSGQPDICYLVLDRKKVLGHFSNYSYHVKPYLGYVETYEAAIEAQSSALRKIKSEEARISNLLRERKIDNSDWIVGATPNEDFTARILALTGNDKDIILVAREQGQGDIAKVYVYMVPRERVKTSHILVGAEVSVKSNVTAQENSIIEDGLAKYGKAGEQTKNYAILDAPTGKFNAWLLGPGLDGKSMFVAQLAGKQRVRNVYRVSSERVENLQNTNQGQIISIKTSAEQKGAVRTCKL